MVENQMEKNMENEMETGVIQGFRGMRVSQNWGYHFGVPIIRTIVYWGLYWGPPIFGKLPYTCVV